MPLLQYSRKTTTKVLQAFQMKPGELTHVGESSADRRRVSKENYKQTESSQKQRELLRGQNKQAPK